MFFGHIMCKPDLCSLHMNSNLQVPHDDDGAAIPVPEGAVEAGLRGSSQGDSKFIAQGEDNEETYNCSHKKNDCNNINESCGIYHGCWNDGPNQGFCPAGFSSVCTCYGENNYCSAKDGEKYGNPNKERCYPMQCMNDVCRYPPTPPPTVCSFMLMCT